MNEQINEPKKLELTSMNITAEQKAKLKQLFPEVFNEGKIDFDKLKRSLGEEIDTGEERYGMNWPGKNDCFKVIQTPSIAALKPCKDESVNFEDTENLFIEGDNLEVLKFLQWSYYGKIKMIYIDPPYNTGNQFIYPDNYSESLETYLNYTNQKDEDGSRFSTNTESDGRFHSKWINMMYPRLFLARNLLKDNGVIFISIDDNEVHNLRTLMNEVFGEENFFAQLIIQSNKRGQTYKQISKTHEYILVYTKNSETEFNEIEKTGEKDDLNLKDNIGRYNTRELRNRNPKFGKFNRPNLFYPFYVNPNIVDSEDFSPVSLDKSNEYNIEVYPFNSEGKESCWRWGKELVIDNINKDTNNSNVVAKAKNDGNYNIYEKYRKTTFKPKSIWTETGVITEKGTVELGELGLSSFFDFPKPLLLLKKVLQLGTNPEDIILDFFSGSCTTAHAVMALNAEDGGNRKFIMVQLPEVCDEKSEAFKAGFKTIADIGKERIRRVIKKIKQEQAEKQKDANGKLPGMVEEQAKLDLGFRVFKLDKSNFNIWDGTVDETGNVAQKLELFIDHIDSEASDEDILYEILLKSGFELTTKIETLTLAGKTVYSIADKALLICLDRKLTKEVITEMADLQPARVVCLDAGFADNDQLKTNAVQIMKSHDVEDFRTV